MEQIQNFINPDTITGAIITLIIPAINKVYHHCKNKHQFDDFKNMIDKEYIKPIEDLVGNYKSYEMNTEKSKIQDKLKKLDYLLENEIVYLNTDNKFKIIRLIEYTKFCFKKLIEVSDEYGYSPLTASYNSDKDKEKVKKLNKVVQEYKNTREKYINLEIDDFPFK
jgi:hypothetical protein